MPRTASGASTREGIREAAAQLFRERGYAGTSVREIASAAGYDPALVIRHFGSKEQLFLETVHLTLDDKPFPDGPLETFGRRFIEYLLASENHVRDVFLALVRGSDETGIGFRLRSTHEATFVEPLRRRLSGSDADLRARLAAALVGGLLYALWVVGDESLLSADHSEIVTRYGALLQELITPSS